MPRPKDNSYANDPEYIQFEKLISDRGLCPATAKSYRTSYRKCRNLFQKPIRDTAEDTAWKTIQVAEPNINTVQSLINICILVRQIEPQMPHDELIEQRSINRKESWTLFISLLWNVTFLERHSCCGTSQGEGKHNGQREASMLYSTSTTRHMRTSLTVTQLTHATTFWQHLVLPPPPCYGVYSGP